jgi:hypothetical protein
MIGAKLQPMDDARGGVPAFKNQTNSSLGIGLYRSRHCESELCIHFFAGNLGPITNAQKLFRTRIASFAEVASFRVAVQPVAFIRHGIA